MLSFLNPTVRACVCLQCLFYADQTKHPKLTSRGLHWVFDGNSLNPFKIKRYLLCEIVRNGRGAECHLTPFRSFQ